MTEQQFFDQLLHKTRLQFEMSPIYNEQIKEGRQWHYSVCGTPIQKGAVIILGINWGASGNHEPQSVIPDGSDIESYRFIQRSKSYLLKYLNVSFRPINFNYTNLCFFRTPTEKQLLEEDYLLSLPLFHEFVSFVEPPWLLSLGVSNAVRLQGMGALSDATIYKDAQNKYSGIKAKFSSYDFYAVPHPNARVSNNSRQEIWHQLFCK